jgi:gamma-glutamyltranspeptidase/glutathione hydrolase
MRAASALAWLLAASFAAASAAAEVTAPEVPSPDAPELATGRVEQAPSLGSRFMVVAAHPAAARAGAAVLRRGGNAMDAAVTVQLVLGLVEPQSSGVGGGSFILHYDAASGRVRSYDGRETAPAAARGDLFLDADGKPLPFATAVVSGRAVGVPGTLAALELAHRAHGRLAWSDVVAPAVVLAREGFAISPRLHALLARDPYLPRDAAAEAYFYRDGKPRPAGERLTNARYAALLQQVADGGAAALQQGDVAVAIVRAVRDAALPGAMTVDDVAAYRAIERAPLCGPFRRWRVCSMGPPSAGGIALLQMLGVIERLPRTDFRAAPVPAAHAFAEAGRLAYADRDRYAADPDFAPVPVTGLLDAGYLDARARLVRPDRSLGVAAAGVPPGAMPAAPGVQPSGGGTTHFSIVDADGNAAAVSSSIEQQFGNRTMTHGFLLNNELTDFSWLPERDGIAVANRVQGGKRPRSAMTPALVFDAQGRLLLVVGSPGGPMIINYVARTLVALLDWELAPQAALELPNFGSRNGPTDVERGASGDRLAHGLSALGHDVRRPELTSGVHLILRTRAGWVGAADPRREGVAVGE